jgi:hypothetical protein
MRSVFFKDFGIPDADCEIEVRLDDMGVPRLFFRSVGNPLVGLDLTGASQLRNMLANAGNASEAREIDRQIEAARQLDQDLAGGALFNGGGGAVFNSGQYNSFAYNELPAAFDPGAFQTANPPPKIDTTAQWVNQSDAVAAEQIANDQKRGLTEAVPSTTESTDPPRPPVGAPDHVAVSPEPSAGTVPQEHKAIPGSAAAGGTISLEARGTTMSQGGETPRIVVAPALGEAAIGETVTLSKTVTRAEQPAAAPHRGAQSTVGIAVLQNNASIVLSAASLWFRIEERLSSLRLELPNSDEAKLTRDQAISDYAELKERVEALIETVSKFASSPGVEEKTVLETTTSFTAAINNWWGKRHVQTFDTALFLGGLGICTLFGAGGPIAAAICGTLVGGKQIAEVIKTLGKANGADK